MYNEFWMYLDNIATIEDLAVLAYSCIYRDFNTKNEHKYKPEEHNDIQSVVSLYFEEQIYMRSYAIQNLIENLKCLHTAKEFSFSDLYCIIKTIDINYSYNEDHFNVNFSNFFSYKSLSVISSNPDVFFVPKMEKNYISYFDEILQKSEKKQGQKRGGLRKKLNYDGNSINSYLSNIILIHTDEIGNCKIHIHEFYCRNNKTNFVNSILDNGYFKTLVVPVNKRVPEELFDIGTDENFFWINGFKEGIEDKILGIYINAIEKYKETDINFIVFPEMFLTQSVLTNVQNYLRNSYKSEDSLQIYVLGSMWSDFSNKTVVMASDGEIVFIQSKKIPFVFKGLKEKLLNEDDTIHIIDFKGFSRTLIFICKEITDDKLMTIPKCLGANLIIAPSFSESMDMKGVPKQLASCYHCTTIMANACSPVYVPDAVKNKKDIGFICQPSKNGTESDCFVSKYCFEANCDDCCDNCDGFIVNIDYKKLMDSDHKTFSTNVFKQ